VLVDGLVYEYPTARALDEVSFGIERGSITALVGPNGAGKTTLMRCLAALQRPLSGSVEINGYSTEEQPREVHRSVGYLSDFYGLYDQLTVEQTLRYAASRHGIDEDSALSVATRVGLADRLQVGADALSRGLRQRLAIASAILHTPMLLILDEPAAGLDPQARVDLSELFTDLRAQGMTLIVSSHILSELEDYATDVLMMSDGRIVEHRSMGSDGEVHRFVIEMIGSSDAIAEIVAGWEGVRVLERDSETVTLECTGDRDEARQAIARVVSALVAHGISLSAVVPVRASIQEAYLSRMNAEIGR
jgi:ABC-2 type transport system ATP-binding protein